MRDNILVIGGTGKTGRKVVELLQQKSIPVRVGSRRATPAFDWHQPEGWSAALEGITKMYITYQPDLAVPGAAQAIEGLMQVAKQQGVEKVVILSGKGEQEAENCERIVMESGLDYTIVRASWFNQNFNESFLLDPILAGEVALPQGKVPVPFVDTDDIAAVVTEALIDPNHNGKIYQLTGPQALTFEEAIQAIAQASDRTINFHHLSLEAYAEILDQAGLPADYAWLINYLFKEVLGNPAVSDITSDIESVLGRPAISFQQFVNSTVNSGVWTPQPASI